MSEKRHKVAAILLITAVLTVWTQSTFGQSARTLIRQGNKLYADGNFNKAINQYDQALVDTPQAPEPKFNKANSYYRLDDLGKAMDLYKQVAAEARDMNLVTKAKFNLGNCYFQQGSKQRDSDLQKALDDMKMSIVQWRGVLYIEPENEKAARNIEVARLVIKDILDQLDKQKQQQDPNQPQQQQDQTGQGQDQNMQQEPNEPQQKHVQDANEAPDQNEPNQQQRQEQQRAVAADATAQEILDKEQRQKQQRQILQRGRYERVKKDW